ncbi:Glu/Leu/Phe/Val dehydrogenase dimerization domain-containing protein [Stenotrophomonas sp.]|uniref:Glu/Leu/Phe/Val dehydrogenase dimerization domain-containing protein n=1 Tax=Stenotrophomonas sp. TaxID=69392 RepID=UPI0028A6D079|nr:Glu/Leu/Phe/Val dehydrogenase dimerization domain-containing protein [Stenotrophomonas sp.]
MLFDTLETSGHEQVLFCQNRDAGLKAIIAIHNTTLGPALGGVRMRPYANTDDALRDVLRLSRTMTYKNALAGLNVGGGKAVIIGDPRTAKSEVLFRAFGRQVEALAGRYITAEDVGTDVNDMENIYLETGYVTGVHQVHGGSGDPAPFTAYGALQALMASVKRKFGHEEIGKLSIAVQGLGHIGMELVKLLRERGAKLYVTDLDPVLVQKAVSEYGCEAVKPDAIYDVAADVFAPCAMEGAIDMATLERLKAKVICGTANNQLTSHAVGDELYKRGVLWAPDYAVNAGGVMNVSLEIDGYNRERAMRLIRSIYHNLDKIFDQSERDDVSPQRAADRIAESRLEAIGKLKMPMGRSVPRMNRLRGE